MFRYIVPWSVAASSLTSMICRRYDWAYFKAFGYTVFKNISLNKMYIH
jgi:hypothetical protein